MFTLPRRRRSVSFLRLLALVVMMLGGLLPFTGVANAAGLRILIVSTGEEAEARGTLINNNFLAEFQNNTPAGSTVVTNTIELDDGDAAPADFFSGYDIVVVDAVFNTIDEPDRTTISNAVLNKSSNVFVFFIDSCGGCSKDNATWFLELIRSNASSFKPAQGAEVSNYISFPLNASSKYAGSFQGALDSISGGFYKPYTDVPADYILYKEASANLGSAPGNAYGLLLPLGEAKGSCTFATTDSSMFDNDGNSYRNNEKKVAPAFYAAAQGGSCFATVPKADLGVSIAASSNTITTNGQLAYKVTVNNLGPDAATNASVALTLPTGLTFSSGTGCAADSKGSVTCSLGTINASSKNELTIQVAASGTAGSTLSTRVKVSSEVADPSLNNNVANIVSNVRNNTWGDVHIRTPDGLVYDFQEVGDFLLLQSDSGDVVVQARQETWKTNPKVSINTAVAMYVGGDKLEFYLMPERRFYINDELNDLPTGDLQLPKGGSILINQSGNASQQDFTILWPDGNTGGRVILYADSHLDIGVARLNGSLTYKGVLGNLDTDPQNDMQIRDGEQLTPPASFSQLKSFGDSWRVQANESLFRDVAPTSEAATAIPTEAATAAPTEVVASEAPLTLLDLDPTAREQAKQTCQNANITDPLALDTCTYDVAATGDDVFVQSAQVVEASVKELPAAANVNVPAVQLPAAPTEQPTAATAPTEQPTAATAPTEQPTAATAPAEQPTAVAAPAAQPTAAAAPAAQPTSGGGLLANPIILLVVGVLVVIVIIIVVVRRR